MPSVEERLDAVKSQIADAHQAKVRAEVQRDQAQAALDKARGALRDEFGVETDEQARAVLKDLEAERDRLLSEAEAALEEAT